MPAPRQNLKLMPSFQYDRFFTGFKHVRRVRPAERGVSLRHLNPVAFRQTNNR